MKKQEGLLTISTAGFPPRIKYGVTFFRGNDGKCQHNLECRQNQDRTYALEIPRPSFLRKQESIVFMVNELERSLTISVAGFPLSRE